MGLQIEKVQLELEGVEIEINQVGSQIDEVDLKNENSLLFNPYVVEQLNLF